MNLENERSVLADLEEQLLDSNLTEAEIAELENQIEASTTQLAELKEELDLIKENIKQERINAANQLFDENEEILTTSIPAENEKTVNAIYLQTLVVDVDEFSEEQLNAILSVASQCHKDGGDAIYRAKSLCAHSFPDYVYNNELCEGTAPRISTFSENQAVDFSIKPNPANSMVQLNFSKTPDFEGEVKIVSLMGTQIIEFEKTLETNQLAIDIANLNSGIYFVQIWSKNKLMSSEKLSIIK